MNLEFFKREKSYLRKIAHEFSLKFPKVAGHLSLGAQESGDPQVERLIESFAFLTGNIQQVIEGEFPEVSTALLGILYPNLVSPIPSMSIARFDMIGGEGFQETLAKLPKGLKMFAETTSGSACYFKSAYEVDLLPVEVDYASLESVDRFSFLDRVANVGSVIRLRFKTLGSISLTDLPVSSIRLYLNGDPMIISQLYETLFCHLNGMALLPEGSEEPVYLPQKSITPVGFTEQESVIPSGSDSHPAFGLLQEYFTFPEKFHFVDLHNLSIHQSESQFDVLFILDNSPNLDLSENTFVTNCTPIVNLFEKDSGSIELDNKKLEYHLVPDYENESTTEVHSVIEVSKLTADEEDERVVEPFYAFRHHQNGSPSNSHWHLHRKESWTRDVKGTEVFLSFRDMGFNHSTPPTERVFVKTLCTNRQLAEKIPAGALLEVEDKGLVQQIVCLKKPTAPINPPLRGPTLWRLISNLSLNYLSLSGTKESLSALRSILRTYNFSDNPTTEQQIMGIRTMEVKKTLNHTGFEGWRGFRKGLEITLTVDPAYFAGSSAYLFASVLRKFFSMYVTVNSFAETVLKKTTEEGIWKRWSPVNGIKVTL